MNAERPTDGASEPHPPAFPHPFAPHAETPAPPGYPGATPGAPSNAWPAVTFQPPPPEPPRRRGPLFYALCIGTSVAVVGLLVQGTLLAIPIVSDFAEEASASLAEPTGDTVLSESWYVDGVEVAYIEEGGTPCENEFESCWEWLLMSQPDCATATVTIEIGDTQYGETQRWVEQSVASEPMTSVLVEPEAEDGDYADITAITCE